MKSTIGVGMPAWRYNCSVKMKLQDYASVHITLLECKV